MEDSVILLVNDNKFIGRMMCKQIEGWGFKNVIFVESAEEALSKVSREKVDFVISDIYMPHIDGWQLCRLLKSEEYEKHNQIPVLLVSATYKDSTAEQLAWDVGAFAFLQVPYDEEDLKTIILSQLSPEKLGRERPLYMGTKGRVLVVDDDRSIVNTLQECLTKEGYDVSTARDGVEALKAVETKKPQLMFIDYQMPKMNGMKVLKWVKMNRPESMVVMITAHGSETIAASLMKSGAEDYLKKPFDLKTIPRITARCFNKLNIKHINQQFMDKMEKVRASEEKYRNLFEKSVDPISIMDFETGRLLEMNSSYEALTGFERDFLLGKTLGEIQDSDRQAETAKSMDELRMKGQLRFEETEIVRMDGTKVPVDINASVIEYGGRKVIQAFFRDLSVTRQLQEQLIQSEKLSSIGQLVSGVAHEINNPLTGIIGFSQMLAEKGDIPDEIQEDLGKIYKEAKRCQRIVGNLLKFARAEKVKRAPVKINALLDESISLKEYALKVSNIEVVKDYEPRLPVIIGDPYRLQQVFINIVNNAHDAMAEAHGWGTLKVRTYLKDDDVYVEFTDDGPGIRDAKKVFDPFYTTKEVGKGTGLGLSLSYGIIKEHGGEIRGENLKSKGARFLVTLPVPKASVKPDAVPPPVLGGRGSGERILIIDDEDTVLEVSQKILSQANYNVDLARSGEEALNKIKQSDYDLILTDLRMPGPVHGMDLYKWVRENKPGSEKKIIFVTGDTVRKETKDFLDTVPNQCLVKPFSIESLQEAVKNALKIKT